MWIKTNCDDQIPSIVKCYRFYFTRCYGMKGKNYVLNGVANSSFWGKEVYQIAYFSSKEEVTSVLNKIVLFLRTSPDGVFELEE